MTGTASQPVEKPSLLPLPPHPAGLAWPTESWPRADLDPRVDRVALERLLNHAFADTEPEDLERTNAVVVVQRGAVVAERYRKGVDPDRAFISQDDVAAFAATLPYQVRPGGALELQQRRQQSPVAPRKRDRRFR